jgi:hypothetical protein
MSYFWIELLCFAGPVLGTLLAFIERIKTGKGIGLRFIQVMAILYIIPAIVVLALENRMMGEAATILGTIAGFVLGTLKDSGGESK